jgi:hypothetical protein
MHVQAAAMVTRNDQPNNDDRPLCPAQDDEGPPPAAPKASPPPPAAPKASPPPPAAPKASPPPPAAPEACTPTARTKRGSKPKPARTAKKRPPGPAAASRPLLPRDLLDEALRASHPPVSREEIIRSADGVAAAFASMFMKLTVDLLSSVAQLAVQYRGTRLGLLYAHSKAVHPQERRELRKALALMHAAVGPTMTAWANVRLRRGDGLVSVLLRILAWAAPGADGSPPACRVRDGMFACELMNRLSDRFFERGLAYSIARVGSVMLLCLTVLLRLVGLQMDFLRAACMAQGGPESAAGPAGRITIEQLAEAAERGQQHRLSISAFRLRAGVTDRLAALAFPDEELLTPPPTHRREAADHVRIVDSLPVLGDDARDPIFVFALVNGLYETGRELVALFPRLELDRPISPAAAPGAFLFVGDSAVWTEPDHDRYDEARWEVHPMADLERALAVALTSAGLAHAAME